MKKKLFFGMFAAAGMLLAASCQNEELDSVLANGGESEVSFTIALDGEAGVRTRAISDGLTVNNLYWEVYDSEGNEVETLKGEKLDAFIDGEATVDFNLAKGQTYTFAFWAQKDETYSTDDLTNVVLDCAGIVDGNDENRDAFFAYTEPVTVGVTAGPHTVILKRPFAQLNLGVSDLAAFEAAGITLDQVMVTVSEVANSFNVLTGEAADKVVDMTFSLADVICNVTDPTQSAEMLTLSTPLKINDQNVSAFDWLSMNYLLVNDGSANGASSSTVDVTFTVKTSHDDIVLTSTSTPVQRNYRTNLIARLTSKEDMKIVIDKNYNGENVKELNFNCQCNTGESQS